MKIVKKQFLNVIMLLVVMVVAFSSCNSNENATGNSNNEDSTQTPQATSFAETKELNILTWAGYVPDEVVSDFENEFGVKVYYSTFDTNDEMYSKIQAQKGAYDIVVCSDYIIENMNKDGMLTELDDTLIANYKNINTAYQGKYYDPDNKYTIPYAFASAIIVYDKEKVGFEIKGYNDLLNETLKSKIVVVDGDRDIIGLALLAKGHSINETDPDNLKEAEDFLMQLKPNIIKYDANVPHEAMIIGDATVGYMYGSQITAAMIDFPELEICYPEEGIAFAIDNIVVPKDAPNIGNAYKFLNYILDGEVSAKAQMLINYPGCNTAAGEFLSEDFKNNKSFFLPQELLDAAEMYKNVGDARTLYDDIWTKLKN